MITVRELIRDLQEVERLHGNIEVVNDLDIGVCEVSVKSYGKYNVKKYYVSMSGYPYLEDYETKDEDLYDIDLSKPIEIVLTI